MRDDLWLHQRFVYLWQTHFADVTDGNEIVIRFGRKSKSRLGSITLRHKDRVSKPLTRRQAYFLTHTDAVSVITINGRLRDLAHPEQVIDAVIAHEFCHYYHGFNSKRKRMFSHPHAGGIIEKECYERGLHDTMKFQKRWLKENWKNIVLSS
ncbi:MAG: hypothetical protein WC045_00955 [Patescibacteria group bacterium]